MKAKSVWVVEQGVYSDYRVVGVFSSYANAELVRAAIATAGEYSDPSIAKWTMDPAVEDLANGRKQYFVLMLRDGTVERSAPHDIGGYNLAGEIRIWERTKAPAYRGQGIPDALQATVWAKDEKHAIKIANEHRTRLIAEGKWK